MISDYEPSDGPSFQALLQEHYLDQVAPRKRTFLQSALARIPSGSGTDKAPATARASATSLPCLSSCEQQPVWTSQGSRVGLPGFSRGLPGLI